MNVDLALPNETQPSTKTIVRSFLEALGRGDIRAVAGMLTEDAVWSEPNTPPIPGTFQGRGLIERHLIDVWQISGGETRHVQIRHLLASGDTVAAICTGRTRRADDPFPILEVLLFRLQGARISRVSAFLSGPADGAERPDEARSTF